MSKAPEAITAYNEHLRGYSFTARGQHGTFGPVEYIRADIHAARIAELERQLAEARDQAMEDAALRAESLGVYPELNVYNGGPEWYKHGKRIASVIRAMKGAKP